MVRAAAVVGPGAVEVIDLDLPELSVGAVVRVEICGLCGTDVEQFHGRFETRWPAGPVVPGHEIVGVIEEIDASTSARWRVSVGDRVAVEPNIPCGTCARCLEGAYVSCTGWPNHPMAYGFIPVSHEHGLWGGWAEHVVLHPSSAVHRVPDGMDAGTASLFNALGAGYRWAVTMPRLQVGQNVVVTGAGQRGLACVAAARAAGAGSIVVSGLGTDRHKLDAARALGADVAVDVSCDDLVEAVAEATRGEMADVVVDSSSGSTEPVLQAIECVRDAGTIVLAGLKGGRLADGVPVDDIVLRGISLLGARSADWSAYEQALRHLSADATLARFRTHELSLDDAAQALRILGGEMPDAEAIFVSIAPGMTA